MNEKVLNKYLGTQNTDFRKEELLKDLINLDQWEANLIYVESGIERDMISIKLELEESEEYKEQIKQILDSVNLVFAKVVDSMRGPAGGVDYPPGLVTADMLWYIAAYPDVINFFYPTVTYLPYDKERVESETNKIDIIRANRRKILRNMENLYFPNMNEVEPTVTEYFVSLKDFYKTKNKLLLAQ